MSAMPGQHGNPLQELARTLFTSFDGTGNSQLSADEFTTFVHRLMTTTTAPAAGTARLTASAFSPVTTTVSSMTLATGPRSSMEGFDFGKIANASCLSARYRFARVAWHYDVSAVTDQASAEAVLKNMVPDLEKSGLAVLDVKGDHLKLRDDRGEFWVGVVRGGNGDTPAFQWLDGPVS